MLGINVLLKIVRYPTNKIEILQLIYKSRKLMALFIQTFELKIIIFDDGPSTFMDLEREIWHENPQ